MASKVFCIGLSRTGTTALHEVLLQLGFRSVHYIEELIAKNDLQILDQYDAAGDAPIPVIYKQLDERFPNSKFILTTRNKDHWLSSMKWLFQHGRVIWNWTPELGNYHCKLYGCNRFQRKTLIRSFDKYHAQVRDYFKSRPNDLLEIDIDNGFDIDAICKFLDVAAVETKIDHHSDRRNATAWESIKYYTRHLILNPLKGRIGGR